MESSSHKASLPRQQDAFNKHGVPSPWEWESEDPSIDLVLGDQGSEETSNKSFTCSVTQKQRSSSLTAQLEDLFLY